MFLATSSFYPEAASEDPIQPHTKAYAKVKTSKRNYTVKGKIPERNFRCFFLSVIGF